MHGMLEIRSFLHFYFTHVFDFQLNGMSLVFKICVFPSLVFDMHPMFRSEIKVRQVKACPELGTAQPQLVYFLLFDFYYYGVRQFLVKSFFEIFWGNLPFGPLKNLKNSRFSKLTPYDPL